ncbi:MAG: Cgl0159 family (beta/alpha)8-fold protein, partial [Acidimicrobiia bacterium]
VETRARRPEVIAELARSRKRRDEFDDGRGLFLITADDPARANLQIGAYPVALGDRKRLLDRLTSILESPGVDGLIATPDIVGDLVLLGALDDKLVLGSMNRSGLAGSTWEVDDRFTSYDPSAINTANLDGGKMTLRLDWKDPGSNEALRSCASAIGALGRKEAVALVEPLPVFRDAGRARVANDPDGLIRAISVAGGLGAVSAFTWLKVPMVRDMAPVLGATSMPVLIGGGDPGVDRDEAVARWRDALALPQARGVLAGRSLLFPADGDVDRAVGAVAEALGR